MVFVQGAMVELWSSLTEALRGLVCILFCGIPWYHSFLVFPSLVAFHLSWLGSCLNHCYVLHNLLPSFCLLLLYTLLLNSLLLALQSLFPSSLLIYLHTSLPSSLLPFMYTFFPRSFPLLVHTFSLSLLVLPSLLSCLILRDFLDSYVWIFATCFACFWADRCPHS